MSAVPGFPLADERESVTRKITIHGAHSSLVLYATVSFYPNDEPAEIFIKAAKKGSTLGGFASAGARMVSVSLHRGVSWSDVVEKFRGMGFEPSGETHSELGRVGSPLDAVIRFVEKVKYERGQKKRNL